MRSASRRLTTRDGQASDAETVMDGTGHAGAAVSSHAGGSCRKPSCEADGDTAGRRLKTSVALA